ncbi:hypothetical protein SCHPADRAFT_873805 [Schizopora paradoxa]|uniref:PD-(D/E)XK endonuclease-like domain-containing protein n=1 Tax=Schizopora paradoxa TaxID=27342 RepID=A0A0H2RPX6_9AGAM|nr:hypothetical protein SCHPADRAFT_873805 [Schizopora paradoxa]
MSTRDNEDRWEPSLSATKLAIHHHLKCDLYLHNSYHNSRPTRNTSKNNVNATTDLTKAQFQRGDEWERALNAWLDAEGLLIHVRSTGPLTSAELQDIIEFEERPHFFISGLYFNPPNSAFADRFAANGFRPVKFGVAKPDLVEVKRFEGKTQWQVIDAKASKEVKASHYVQTYFYHMCLEHMLSGSQYVPMGQVSIWIAPQTTLGGEASYKPSFDGLKSSAIELLSLTLDNFFFTKLPTVVQSSRDKVAWHYNPLCKGCPFEAECSERTVLERGLGLIPNLSIPDFEVLKSVLNLTRSRHPTAPQLSDIEDLAALVRPKGDLPNLQATHPALIKKAKRILHLPERSTIKGSTGSPRVNSALEKKVKLIDKRNFTLPKGEDIAILISLIIDPSTNDIAYYCISVISSVTYFSYRRLESAFSTKELVKALSNILQSILDLKQAPEYSKTTAQVYVYSVAERTALQRLLVQAALSADPLDEVFQSKLRLCIGALCEGASVLATTFQPSILSGAMLDFLGKKVDRSRSELLSCLSRLGLSYSQQWTNEMLRQTIESELERRKIEGGRGSCTTDDDDVSRNEIGLVPRVVAVEREVKSLLALPIPGYWDLRRCHAALRPNAVACPSDEEIFTAYRVEDDVLLDDLLKYRNQAIHDVVKATREHVQGAAKEDLLVNHARILSSDFMDVCRQDDLRKLFFMQQFEVLAKLNELWEARINGCPDAVILQYRYTHRRPSGDYQHFFELLSGNVDMATDKDRSFFNFILTEDKEDVEIPAEALFDDLGVFNCVFPLKKYNRFRWSQQARKIRQSVFVADVVDLRLQNNNTLVVAKTFGDFDLKLKPWAYYRLSPRLVDFNLTKVLSSLIEMDLKTPLHPGYMSLPPFLQLCSDPRGFASQSSVSPTESTKELLEKELLEKEKAIHTVLRELSRLNVDAASDLMLKPSQRRGLKRVLTHRLAIIWGPPGECQVQRVNRLEISFE